MEFLRNIKKSIYDVAFYAVAKTESFGPALKQYTLFVLGMAFLVSIPIYISFNTWSSQMKEAGDIRTKVLAVYPDELVLNFQNGQMTSNVEEPYSIPMPKDFEVKEPKNLIVINTRGTITADDFSRYDTAAILGGDAFWSYDAQKDKIEIQKFSQYSKGSFVVNKQKVTEWTDLVLKVGEIVVTVLLFFLPLLLFVLFWFGYLIYLLFGAIIIWIVAKLRRVDLTYGQAYKLGLYLLTLPIIYSALTMGPLSGFKIPFGFTIILIIVTYINLIPTKTEEIPPVVSENTFPLEQPVIKEATIEEKQ